MTAASQRPQAAQYRPDIDGLRALAVFAVILFHAGVPGFAGGYVGVDVFFVVSGYLITRLLVSAPQRSAGAMLSDFYARRARRILPALLVTCAGVGVVGWVLLPPAELVRLGKQLAAAPVFLSNLAAWSEGAGYFEHSYLSAPLHHLWSIAVEEQFYVVYPLLLLAVDRYLPRRRERVIALLALLSLALCIWASHHRAGINYYAAVTRAWELLLGGLISLRAVSVRSRAWREVAAALGLSALAACVWLYDPMRISYPGPYTLLPCAATAALVTAGAGEGSTLSRVLAWRPLVFAGLISYSLYLWHQPVLLFAAYYHITPLSALEQAAAIGSIFVLAVLSWRFIEQPVRSRTLFKSPRAMWLVATTASALVLAGGLLLWKSDGFPRRLPAPERAFLPTPNMDAIAHCMTEATARIRAGRPCSFADASGAGGSALLWGDSHALAVLPAFEELAAARHMRLYFVAHSSCWPILGGLDRTRDVAAQAACSAFNAAVVDATKSLNPSLVILAGRWNDENFAAAPGVERLAGESEFSSALRKTVRSVEDGGRRALCVVLDVPQLKYPGSHALMMAQRRRIADDFLTVKRTDAQRPVQRMEGDVRSLAQAGALRFADPKAALCPGEDCLYKANGRSLYFDNDHISRDGAEYVRQELESCFEPAPRAQ